MKELEVRSDGRVGLLAAQRPEALSREMSKLFHPTKRSPWEAFGRSSVVMAQGSLQCLCSSLWDLSSWSETVNLLCLRNCLSSFWGILELLRTLQRPLGCAKATWGSQAHLLVHQPAAYGWSQVGSFLRDIKLPHCYVKQITQGNDFTTRL